MDKKREEVSAKFGKINCVKVHTTCYENIIQSYRHFDYKVILDTVNNLKFLKIMNRAESFN